MITAESIDRVREAADIVEIVGEHVKLRRTGADFRGPCPFHNGKGPNFSVSPKRGAYHCFVCHVSGDVFTFVRERLGMEFVEAVKYVAARAGVTVEETAGRRDEREADPREPLWEALAAAAEFYRDALWRSDEGAAAREYLEGRKLRRDEAERFGLGYSARDPAPLRAHLNALGHDDERLLAAGLLSRRDDDPQFRARFRGRLMFPIVDTSGRNIGFGGRIIGAGEPKYLNSPESDVFSKGRQLYALHSARHPIRKADRVLLVEGYFDAIRLAVRGLDEVVAPLGTALTEQQAAILARLTKNVFLLYDSDTAGLKATFRAGLELLGMGVSARVVSLPQGEDPDTFVQQHGAERLEALLGQAVDIFDRQVLEIQRRGWFAELHTKRRAIDKLLPTLRVTTDPMTREIYAGRLAEVAGIDREVILREAMQPDARAGARGAGAAESPESARARPPAGEGGVVFVEPRAQPRPFTRDGTGRGRFGDRRRAGGRRDDDWASSAAVARVSAGAAVTAAEKGLVRAMLHDPDQVALVAERWGPAQFHDATYRRIFEHLLASDSGALVDDEGGLAEEDVRVVNALTAEPLPDPASAVDAWIRKLEVRALDEALEAIRARLFDVDRPLSEAEKDTLLRRRIELRDERRALSSAWSRVGSRAAPRLPEA